jgi:uncharacterized protein (TIGR02246 family)
LHWGIRAELEVEVSLANGVVVRLRPDHQRGLFVLRSVREHEVLITYDGPIIVDPTRYSIQIDDNLHIDGTPESNAYLNHCCAPNTYVDWKGVFLRALRDIGAEEELTCNYLTTDWELHEQFVCSCGAPNCYREIRGFKYLSPDQQRALQSFVPEFMRKRIGRKEEEKVMTLPVGIEKLHQDDIAATLSRDAEGLTALWDDDGVLLQPGHPAIIGKAAFRDFVKQTLAKTPSAKVLKYEPEICDVQVVGDVAFEWGYFDSTVRPSDQEQPINVRARFVRILQRQPDGCWRFSRVIWASE